MKRLRVLHLDSGAEWRGGQRQALLLALGLRDRGHEPFLIGVPGSPLVERARGSGLAVATIKMRADWDVRAARKIRARMRAWAPDIVHAHDARSHALAMIALLGRREVPLIVTRRVPFTPKSSRIKYGERVSQFIAISNAVKSAMVGGGIDPARVDVVHSGIALPSGPIDPRDWRAELGWPRESVVCGLVGAMTAEKGIDLLETIARSLPPEARDQTRLVLIGAGSAGPRRIGGLEAHAAGFVTLVESAIGGLDVLWHPSRAEGLGTSVLDAMALGVPPIAFAVGGLPEIVENEVSGLLVPPGDPIAFAAAAARLVSDAGLRRRLGEGARDCVRAFDAARMTAGTEAVYYRVLSGRDISA